MTLSPEDKLAQFLLQARDHREIIGVFLSGSRGKGFEVATSDYDVFVVTTTPNSLKLSQHDPPFEWLVTNIEAFREHAEWGTQTAWDRYSFAHVKVLLDKTGEIQKLVSSKGAVPDEQRLAHVYESLDSYLNSLYRSLKCHQRKEVLGCLLEANSSLPFALDVIFGLEKRHKPFMGYLRLELEKYPLVQLSLSTSWLLETIEAISRNSNLVAQKALFQAIEELTFTEFSAVFLGWGEAYPWIKEYLLVQ